MPIVLCYVEGLTHEDAAGQLHLPVGTVKVRLGRGQSVSVLFLTKTALTPIICLVSNFKKFKEAETINYLTCASWPISN